MSGARVLKALAVIVTIFRSSIRTRVAINRARTQILSRAPRGLQKDKVWNWVLALAKGKSTRGTLPCT